jgi:O-antigen/teichoic acid export membrane protein
MLYIKNMTARSSFKTHPIRSISTLFIAMLLVNGLNYANNLILGRVLEPALYGTYATFTAVFLVISLLPSAMQQLGARDSQTSHASASYRLALRWGVIAAVSLVILGQLAASTFQLPSLWLLALAALMPGYALLGALRGQQQTKSSALLSLNLILEHGSKILITLCLWVLTPGLSAAVFGLLGSLLVALIFAWWQLGKPQIKIPNQSTKPQSLELQRFALAAMLGMLAQALINNSDILLVRALLPAEVAGEYAAIAMIGRVIFFASWAVTATLFPMVAKRHQIGQEHTSLLHFGVIAVSGLSLVMVLACSLYGPVVVRVLFGSAYLGGASWLPWYALASGLYATSNVMVSHALATGNKSISWLVFAAAILQIVLIFAFHHSALEVIQVQVIAMSVLLSALGFAAFKSSSK